MQTGCREKADQQETFAVPGHYSRQADKVAEIPAVSDMSADRPDSPGNQQLHPSRRASRSDYPRNILKIRFQKCEACGGSGRNQYCINWLLDAEFALPWPADLRPNQPKREHRQGLEQFLAHPHNCEAEKITRNGKKVAKVAQDNYEQDARYGNPEHLPPGLLLPAQHRYGEKGDEKQECTERKDISGSIADIRE